MALADPPKGYEVDTPTTHVLPWHGPNHGPTYDYDHNHKQDPNSYNLNCHNPDLGPQYFMHLGYSSTAYQNSQACQSSSIWQLIALDHNQLAFFIAS